MPTREPSNACFSVSSRTAHPDRRFAPSGRRLRADPGPICHGLLASQLRPQITPARILALDELYLPGAQPTLDTFLPENSLGNIRVRLEVHEAMNPMFFSEA